MLPPEDLLAAGQFCESTFGSSCGSKLCQTTHYTGDENMQIPVELVSASTGTGHRLARKKQIHGKVMAGVGKVMAGYGKPPPLTTELHTDLKNRMNSLASVCRAHEFLRYPFKLRHFVTGMHEICDLLNMPLAEKTYRRGYGYRMLHAFRRLVPEAIGSEVLSFSGELPLTGFLSFTILLTFCDIQWAFTYNSLTHKMCNCSTQFPGITCCLAPAVGKLSNAVESGLAESLSASIAASLSGVAKGAVSLTDRIENLQQHERHFPTKLIDLSRIVKKRLMTFCSQVPSFVTDIMNMPTQGPDKHSKWAAFVSSWTSEAAALDLYYMHFEQLYLGLIDKMIGTALQPVRGMSGPSCSLVNAWGDPFRPVQIAVLCQRLGLLKQQVSFGGPHNLIHFDSDLLVKAQRVVQMHTYAEVRRMALAMITNFDSLCSVLVNLHDDHVHPELRDNEELRETVIRLEEVWAECQFVLQQGVLDFMQQLLEFLPQLSPTCRWQLRIAMQGDESRLDIETEVEAEQKGFFVTEVDSRKTLFEMNITKEERQANAAEEARTNEDKSNARKMFFETLPILVYLNETRKEMKLAEAGKDTGGCSNFRELFCPQNDRHHMLRRDLGKMDDLRFERFRNFILGVKEEEETDGADRIMQMRNVEKQLREVAAFPLGKSPMEALQTATCFDANEIVDTQISEDRVRERILNKMAVEACARWVCVQRVAQTVQPELFPLTKPWVPRETGGDEWDVPEEGDGTDEWDIPGTPRSPRSPRSPGTPKRAMTRKCSISSRRSARRMGTMNSESPPSPSRPQSNAKDKRTRMMQPQFEEKTSTPRQEATQ